MATTYDLKEITNKFAKKQPEMVDNVTEMAPILERLKWKPATHGMWHQYEKLNTITGAGFTDAGAALSLMDISKDLDKVDLQVLGGYMEQNEDTVDQFGGPAMYFADKEPAILRQAGMDTEVKLYYDNWIAKAIDDGNATDAGASSGDTLSIVAVRFNETENIGLFDPSGFKKGTLLEKKAINGGQRYHLRSQSNVVGYGVTMKGRFGWMNASDRCAAAILNINSSNLPTAQEIDAMLISIRATDRDTMIFMHPTTRALALGPFKDNKLQVGIQDTEYNRRIATWDEIPVITSYNILTNETATTGL